MKKRFVLAAFVLTVLSCPAWSQTIASVKEGDLFTVRQGRLWVLRGATEAPVSEEFRLKDGSKVLANGTVLHKDGSKEVIPAGQAMTLDGKLQPLAAKKSKATPATNAR